MADEKIITTVSVRGIEYTLSADVTGIQEQIAELETADASLRSSIDDNYRAIQQVKTDVESEAIAREAADAEIQTDMSALKADVEGKASLTDANTFSANQTIDKGCSVTIGETVVNNGGVTLTHGKTTASLEMDGIYAYDGSNECEYRADHMTLVTPTTMYQMNEDEFNITDNNNSYVKSTYNSLEVCKEYYNSVKITGDKITISEIDSDYKCQITKDGIIFTDEDGTIKLNYDKFQKLLALIEN